MTSSLPSVCLFYIAYFDLSKLMNEEIRLGAVVLCIIEICDLLLDVLAKLFHTFLSAWNSFLNPYLSSSSSSICSAHSSYLLPYMAKEIGSVTTEILLLIAFEYCLHTIETHKKLPVR